MIPDLQVLKPFSENEARDIEEALKGDYKKYHKRRKDVLLLPDYRSFEERLEKSSFDKISIESPALKYRFLVAFLMKAELSPGLAFGETFLTFIHIITCKFQNNRMRMLITKLDSDPSIEFSFLIFFTTNCSYVRFNEWIDWNYHLHWRLLDFFLAFNFTFLVWDVPVPLDMESFCAHRPEGFNS